MFINIHSDRMELARTLVAQHDPELTEYVRMCENYNEVQITIAIIHSCSFGNP